MQPSCEGELRIPPSPMCRLVPCRAFTCVLQVLPEAREGVPNRRTGDQSMGASSFQAGLVCIIAGTVGCCCCYCFVAIIAPPSLTLFLIAHSHRNSARYYCCTILSDPPAAAPASGRHRGPSSSLSLSVCSPALKLFPEGGGAFPSNAALEVSQRVVKPKPATLTRGWVQLVSRAYDIVRPAGFYLSMRLKSYTQVPVLQSKQCFTVGTISNCTVGTVSNCTVGTVSK